MIDNTMIAGPLATALTAKGYETLTPVQEAVLAEGVAGRDLLVSAQTGSGKTVAFGLAIAPELLAGADKFLFADVPAALVIAPTRELALQVARELSWLFAGAQAQIATCVGGMDYRTEKRALERGAHIVVGTPGRLRDHIERKSLDLSALKAVVLDEADEMLDLGFSEDLEFILAAAPEDRRTLMFSATVPKAIAELAKTFQRDALRIQTVGEASQHADIEYRALNVQVRDREHAIFNLLRYYEARTSIVFCKTRANVNHLMARMGNRGFQVVALSGELSQQERTNALSSLRSGRARVCIATDVAARGIDLPGLELVIHADLPTNSDTLLHRSGRTGRAGSKGVSALIVTPSDYRKASRILQGAKVVAEWGTAPSAEEVQERDDQRILEHPALGPNEGEDLEMAQTLLDRFGAEHVAQAFVTLWREGRSAPEVLSEVAAPGAAKPARERSEFGPSVWFSVSVGHTARAEARWLLPKICDAGAITRDSIGAIRVQQTETFVQIAESEAAKFGAEMLIDTDVTMRRLPGEPSLARPERAPAAPRSPRPVRDADAAPRPPRAAEKPAYKPKPARFVEDDAPARPAAAEAAPREPLRKTAPRKAPVEAAARPVRSEGDASWTPLGKPAAAARPAEAPKDAADRKARWKKDDRPDARSDARPAAKSGYPRGEGAKPYAARSGDAKPAPRSAGFKSHGGAADGDRPAKSTGFKSHAGKPGPRPAAADGAKPWAARPEGAKPWAKPRDGEAGPKPRPFAKPGDGPDSRPSRAGGFKSAGPGKGPGKPAGKFAAKPFVKPAKPKVDAKDTSKRFVPPKPAKG
ncbi:MAG: DEAD/DEAH box helicase [Pseudorhodobacter sp.]